MTHINNMSGVGGSANTDKDNTLFVSKLQARFDKAMANLDTVLSNLQTQGQQTANASYHTAPIQQNPTPQFANADCKNTSLPNSRANDVWDKIGDMVGKAQTEAKLQSSTSQAYTPAPEPANASYKPVEGEDIDKLITLGLLYLYNTYHEDKELRIQQLNERENYHEVVSYDIRRRHARQWQAIQEKKQTQSI